MLMRENLFSLFLCSAIREGTFVFPRVPILRVEGPLAICQLLETPLLNLINFPSLVATNAARYRLAAGDGKRLVEFGVRRAQGPDGAMSASRYTYLGTFDATSNIRAGRLFGIPTVGTHAHSFATSFKGVEDLPTRALTTSSGSILCGDFVDRVLAIRKRVGDFWGRNVRDWMNLGELTAFIAYAQAFPHKFTCLVDTYDTKHSGVPNFLCVAYQLHLLGFEPKGIRLDSGDLAYLSKVCRKMIDDFADAFEVPAFKQIQIMASNDINEAVLKALNEQGHAIDSFGIGTNLVTCQAQSALGLVYKLTEIRHRPCMKVTQEIAKMTFPFRKDVWRMFSSAGVPVCDLLQQAEASECPNKGDKVECRHLLDDKKRCLVIPSYTERLLVKIWEGGRFVGNRDHMGLQAARLRCAEQMKSFRGDHLRLINPTPYKVSASAQYYDKFRQMWHESIPMFTIE